MRLQGKMLAAGVACAMAVAALMVPSATAAKPTIRIWVDATKVDAMEAIASGYKAANIEVVSMENARDNLQTVQEADAPDIFEGAHDWTGELVSNGSIKALSLPGPVLAQFPVQDINAFKYDGKLLGVPMLHESIALVMNTGIAGKTCPATLEQAVDRVSAKLDSGKINTVIQVGPDAYHFYPMMSGLGGAFFKQKANGEYSTKTLVGNMVDSAKKVNILRGWQASGLFQHYAGSYDATTGAFAKGKAAYYITGPWNSNAIRDLSAKKDIKLCKFPQIMPGEKSIPFSGVRGLYISSFASDHGVLNAAKDFLISYVSTSAVQKKYCKVNGCNPSNKNAGVSPNPFTEQFLVTYPDAVPMPNIPEMAAIWGNVSDAWGAALREEDASNPKTAFENAAQNIKDAING